MHRFSTSDWFFALVLWAVAIIAALAWFSRDRIFWTPLMGVLSCLVAAAIVVNLYRFWKSCAALHRRGDN